MPKQSFSLRSDKLRRDSFKTVLQHNRRDVSDKFSPSLPHSSDRERLHLNIHYENEDYVGISTEEELWEKIDNDCRIAIAQGESRRTRVIARITNRRNSTPIETSISREIILQIGSVSDNYVVPLEIYMHFIQWLKKIFLGDIIRWDIHEDESIRHIHIVVTTWSLIHHENYVKDSVIDNYEVFQKKAYDELKSFCKRFDIDILPPEPKEETKKENISPRMFEREILPVQREKEKIIADIKSEQEKLDKVRSDTRDAENSLKDILLNIRIEQIKMQRETQEHKNKIALLAADAEKTKKMIKEHIAKYTQQYKEYRTALKNLKQEIKDAERSLHEKKKESESLTKRTKSEAQQLIKSLAEKVRSTSISRLESRLEQLRSSSPIPSIKIIKDIIEDEEDEDNNFKLRI